MQLFTEEFVEEAIRKEAYDDGRQEGMQLGEQKGRQEGLLEGTLKTLFGLVRDGILTAQIGADRAKLSLAAFNAKMAEYDAMPQA